MPAHRPLAAGRAYSTEGRNRYEAQKLIGAGTFGRVYRALDTQENRLVALKEIKLDAEEVGIPSTALREISLLRELDHPNIVKCGAWIVHSACMLGRAIGRPVRPTRLARLAY